MSRPPMSMEALLDEERREVLALLGQSNANTTANNARSASVAAASRSTSPYGSNPRSPIRSMLDLVDDTPGSPPGSRAASISGPIGGSPHRPVRSLLDIDGSPPAHTPSIRSMLDVDNSMPPISAQSSPTESNHHVQLPPAHKISSESSLHPRSKSDAASKPADFGPRGYPARNDLTASYQFSDIITKNQGPVLSKGKQQHSSNTTVNANQLSRKAMAELMRGADISNLKLPGQKLPIHGRHSVSGASGRGPSKGSVRSSKSPSSRLNARSNSPNVAISGRGLSPAGHALVAETNGLDMQNAYRRLSDANLIRSGGSLSGLPMRKKSDDEGVRGSGRLAKDYLSPDGEHLESSEDDIYSSDEDEGRRGRKTARSFPGEANDSNSPAAGSTKGNRQPLSLLAAAEEERIHVSSAQPAYQYKSLLDEPEITVTNPSGERVKAKSGVTPNSSFEDRSRSASRAPFDSDDEAEIGDIKRAQRLAFTTTAITSTPGVQRSVQIIYRGDFAKVQKQAVEEEHRPVRKYLVATDLSDESTHALEWTVGTVLRDGDTLVAIYCVDEEMGIPLADGQEDPKAAASKEASPAAANPAKAEEDRHRAVQDITERITKLLRRTRLQVRVIVEVLQCKTPRHIITEVIDIVNPTLVILGSRGRSALKGVILGSFSNYLVTKSSVPVMVARKRLRKHYKYRRQVVPQVNNLINPKARSLANAKID